MKVEPCPGCICATCENVREGGLCCATQENQPCGSQACPDYNRKKETEVTKTEAEAMELLAYQSALAAIRKLQEESRDPETEADAYAFQDQVDGVLAMVEEIEKRMRENQG